MSLTSDLLELSRHLQQEYLFVTTEREQLQRLYHNVTILSEKLFHTAWIARQQKQNLQYFIDQGTNAGENLEVALSYLFMTNICCVNVNQKYQQID